MSWTIEGKRVLLTGATRGIGLAAARALAKQGARLSLLVRNRELGEQVAAELRALGNGEVDLFLADLSSQNEIRRVAQEYQDAHDRLDVLINNAGAIFMERQTSVDGYEMTFATNHLSYFLLTDCLLDLLKKSAPARVINVASNAHRGMKLRFGDLMSEKGYSGFSVYGRSKLANILFTKELAERLQGTGVTVNCLHPGVIASGFGHNNKGVFGVLVKLGAPFLSSPEKGARTTVYLATAPEVEHVTGKYFQSSHESRPSAEARNPETAKKLWEASERLVSQTAQKAPLTAVE